MPAKKKVVVVGKKKISGKKSVINLKKSNNQKKPRSLKEALKGKLTKKEFSFLRTSFDTLGNIAILEIPEELHHKEKIIGNALLSANPSLETVCMKTGAHKGEFRIEPVKVIAGKRNKVATYKEHGCTFRISLGKVFFSPRLSTERKRIAELIKEGEVVGALFAGVGPFPIVFAKNSKMAKAYAVELNPAAYKDMLDNIRINKVESKIVPILGDVREVVPQRLAGTCNRAVMPLPMGAATFLKEAIICLRPEGGVIHFYDFVSKETPEADAVKKIKVAVEAAGKSFKVLQWRKVRDYSPDTIQVVVDFEVK
jgi:tRNA (guanine37-N1)-methyltransferase